MEELFIRLVLASAVVFGALGIFVYFLRKNGGQRFMKKLGIKHASTMSIEEVLQAGNKRQFLLLRHGKKKYLIFSTPQGNILVDNFKATNNASDSNTALKGGKQ